MGTSDGMLLERFAAHRDQGAFAEIVRRYGALVMGVCRRVLRNADDAEEAFQATFLILARKAGAVREGASLAGWLHAVATRTALNARSSALRRAAHERSAVPRTPEAPREDLRPALDEEVTRLPDKYRSPVLLCYVQGKTTEHAASELGWAKGTVLTRLARAREMLRSRLAGRGVVTGAAFATVTVSASMVAATAEAATAGVAAPGVGALVSGGLKAMMVAKLKAAAVVLVATAGALASGGVLLAAGGQDKPSVTVAADVDTLPPKIPHEKFDRFHKMLLPTKDELAGFWDLPWEVGIHAARARASAENKPILAYFGANGSSLGAT
ncbi:MAG TPA: RNA polymerase sigma factor [Planctomycetota bacterium]